MNDEKIFDIEFECNGTSYKGWANPSDKLNDDGLPVSFHVVLNEVSLGHLSLANRKWFADEQRPAELVEAAGEKIKEYYKNKSTQINA